MLRTVMRLAWALCIAVAAVAATACTAASGRTEAATSDVVSTPSAPAAEDFTAALEAAYEAAGGTSGPASALDDEAEADWRTLPGKAREAFNYYSGTHGIAKLGGAVTKVGTFRGETVYFIAGDVSDTGTEYGFYDAKGELLALAYSGQGEQPGPGGVDWLE